MLAKLSVRTCWLCEVCNELTQRALIAVLISKKGVVWPFQESIKVSLTPRTYEFKLHNMSKEKLEFLLPIVITIGPDHNDVESLKRFARSLSELAENEMVHTVQGIIEGETRALTATLSVEEMFGARDRFRSEVVAKVDADLSRLGLTILNCNVKELADFDEKSKYFEFRRQRAVETASYEAKVEVAEARKQGEIGVKSRDRDTRIALASMDTEATVQENQRKQTVAQSGAALAESLAQANLRSRLAEIEAANASEKRNEEMLQIVEEARAKRELEKLRANKLTGVRVASEGVLVEAEAKARAIELIAAAELKSEQLRATGLQAVLEAHARGLDSIRSASGANADLVKYYLALDRGLFEKVAKSQADAMQNLKPTISIWNTGDGGSADSASTPIVKMVQSMVPLLDGLHKHAGAAGVSLPFLPNLPSNPVPPSPPVEPTSPPSPHVTPSTSGGSNASRNGMTK